MSEVTGIEDAIATMKKKGDAEELDQAVMNTAAELTANIRGSAPQGETGDLAASWNMRQVGPTTVMVESDIPYAARIEFGFHGTDSLGREYNQEPDPYVAPNLPEAHTDLLSEVLSALGKL